MKLPYLDAYHLILSRFTGHFATSSHSRQTATGTSSSPVTNSRFHFRKTVPKKLKGNHWQLQAIQQDNAALIYDAYLSHHSALTQADQKSHLKEPYTWQEYLKQMATYDQDHQTHKTFSFIVLNKAATKCLGMVQIGPLRPFLYYNNAPVHLMIRAGDNAAMITYWLTPCTAESTFPCQFIQALQGWFAHDWEFDDYFFRVNPSEAHCLFPLADSGLTAHFNLKVPPHNYAFYGN